MKVPAKIQKEIYAGDIRRMEERKTMLQDEQILRELVKEYREAALSDKNQKKKEMHIALNDLKMTKPVLLIDELPWHELNNEGELTCLCQDPYLREIETYLRQMLYRYRHISGAGIDRFNTWIQNLSLAFSDWKPSGNETDPSSPPFHPRCRTPPKAFSDIPSFLKAAPRMAHLYGRRPRIC